MTTVVTRGAASAQALGYAARATAANYIEDVFSTYLVKPTSSNTTYSVTNGVDLSGKGGMVWMRKRDAAGANLVYDTARGASSVANNALITNTTLAQQTADFDYITGLSNGFTVNFTASGGQLTNSGVNYASWTFRKQAKFFDVVTWAGNGSAQTLAHSLGSVPGAIIVKDTNGNGNWAVYHRSLGNDKWIKLNSSDAAATASDSFWDLTNPTSSNFTVGTAFSNININYVAYLFAHDAGGFGASGTDNVISCGSFTSDINGLSISLGYEPQWVIVKATGAVGLGWYIWDNMRGFVNASSGGKTLEANSSIAENDTNWISPTATGFKLNPSQISSGNDFIYIAIRRGPMKTPTSGTSVFSPVAYTGNGSNPRTIGSLNATDLAINKTLANAGDVFAWIDRLRGSERYIFSDGSGTEGGGLTGWKLEQTGQIINGIRNTSSTTYVDWLFCRAPGFFDEVCYTGTGSATTQSHNLGVVPELMIFKRRDAASQWQFYFSALGNTKTVQCPDLDISTSSGYFNNTSPTSSVFTVNTVSSVNASGGTYVAYLAASCAGVSKVGSYTGTGSTQTIDCGFSGGARFVLIKNVGSNAYAYPFYVWDTARGMISGTDPSLQLNSSAAEVNANSVYTTSSGFQIVSTATGINGNGESFVYWAIA